MESQNGQQLSYEVLAGLTKTPFVASAINQHKKPISNFFLEDNDEGEGQHAVPLPMREIITSTMEHTSGWPRRVGGSLFIHDDGINWLENSSSLFGWLGSKAGVIEWGKSTGCVTKEEIFQEFVRTTESYEAVEELPHFPPLPHHYYSCGEIKPGPDDALTRLIESFSPATDDDKMLILAMFATPFWGGKPGSRPAFLITSDSGRGVGKSKITDMLSLLCNGHIELSAGEDASRMRSRLLSPEGLKKRLARLDNVKSLRFSWAEFESIITSPLISGHRLHQGEAGRPNDLTWIITLNGASLSTDIAQRVIVIKLGKPKRSGDWETDVVSFIEANRTEITAGIRSFLETEPKQLASFSRWAAWESSVLARLGDPETIQRVVAERCDLADVERDEVSIVLNYFRRFIESLGYKKTDKIHIPSEIAADWFISALKDKTSLVSACRKLSQFCNEGNAEVKNETGGIHHKLVINPSRKYGRGYVFMFCEGDSENANYDLQDRIDNRSRYSSGNGGTPEVPSGTQNF